MITLTFVALIRLIPYLLSAIIAFRKGYRWMTVAGFYVACLATWNAFAPMNPTWYGASASLFAFFLLLHVLELKPKQSTQEEVK